MKLKTHKALAKRLKITKTGKAMKRYSGQDHFNSRDTGNAGRKKRTDHELSGAYAKAVKTLIPNT
jgi:ribosomal protein L35